MEDVTTKLKSDRLWALVAFLALLIANALLDLGAAMGDPGTNAEAAAEGLGESKSEGEAHGGTNSRTDHKNGAARTNLLNQ